MSSRPQRSWDLVKGIGSPGGLRTGIEQVEKDPSQAMWRMRSVQSWGDGQEAKRFRGGEIQGHEGFGRLGER